MQYDKLTPKCEHCPVKCGDCISQKTSGSFCDRVNPSSASYDPNYGKTLLHFSCGDKYEPSRPYITGTPPPQQTSPLIPSSTNYPSWTQMGKNLAGSMFNFVRSGFELAEEDVYKARLEVCDKCPFFDHEAQRCKVCGCFMKVKAKMKHEKCPKDKWDKPAETENDIQPDFTFSYITHPCAGCGH